MKSSGFRVISLDLRAAEEDGFLYATCQASLSLQEGFETPVQVEVPVTFNTHASLQQILEEAIQKARLAMQELAALK